MKNEEFNDEHAYVGNIKIKEPKKKYMGKNKKKNDNDSVSIPVKIFIVLMAICMVAAVFVPLISYFLQAIKD